jgi:hypothetical protein
MGRKVPPIAVMQRELRAVAQLAQPALRRCVIDRASRNAGLHAVVLGLLTLALAEALCIAEACRSEAPQGTSPNVRSMLESLITILYLTDPSVTERERRRRLDRYYKGVRREQVKLRSALDLYPAMKARFIKDSILIDREKTEFARIEASLPKAERLGRGHWSGLPHGLQSLAEAVGLGSDYALQYRHHSGTTHANRPWDQVPFRADRSSVNPTLVANRVVGAWCSFDAWRYLAWCLAAAHDCGALSLTSREQRALGQRRYYLQPIEVLFAKGIVGSGPITTPKL